MNDGHRVRPMTPQTAALQLPSKAAPAQPLVLGHVGAAGHRNLDQQHLRHLGERGAGYISWFRVHRKWHHRC